MKAKQPYDLAVDWYSLGKLILDCHGRDAHAEECAYWESSGLLELIDALLVKEPNKRRGFGEGGTITIYNNISLLLLIITLYYYCYYFYYYYYYYYYYYWESSGLLELIDALLVKEPNKRRGFGEGGTSTIGLYYYSHY